MQPPVACVGLQKRCVGGSAALVAVGLLLVASTLPRSDVGRGADHHASGVGPRRRHIAGLHARAGAPSRGAEAGVASESCRTAPLLHNRSSVELGQLYNRTGPPLHIGDAFVTPARGPGVSGHQNYTAIVVLNVKVFEFKSDGSKKEGAERLRQKREQLSVYHRLNPEGAVKWTCSWGATGKSMPALPTRADGDSHSLVVACHVPPIILGDVDPQTGILRARLALRATSTSAVEFSLSGLRVCASTRLPPTVKTARSGPPPPLESPPIFMAACTMVTEIHPKFNVAALTRLWLEWLIYHGVEHVLIYVDANKREPFGEEPALERAMRVELAPWIKSGHVELIMFHLRGRGWLETQQMMETHCLWRYRNVAKWVVHNDVDEFLQPLGQYKTIAGAIQAVESAHSSTAAFQVRQSFWGHLPFDNVSDSSLAIQNMTWRSSGPFKRGREKLILDPSRVDYISVHQVTTPRNAMHSPNPESELRLNHFRRHFKGIGAEDAVPSWRNSGIGPRPVRDTSFQRMWSKMESLQRKELHPA